jgi:drug/metabolite transporter (DMT)-like permease
LFGAAPTVALATLGIAFIISPDKIGSEGRSMMIGGVAFFIYTLITRYFLKKHSLSALPAAVIAYLGWFGSAYLLWLLLLK